LVPSELADHRRFIIWRWEWDAEKAKWDKPPCDPATGVISDAHNSANWVSAVEAIAAAHRFGADGIGFSLGKNASTPFAVVDIDDCIGNDGNLSPLARWIVDELRSYTEITPAGRGLRVWVQAALPPRKGSGAWLKFDTIRVEFYECRRYLTVTGQRLVGCDHGIENRPYELAKVHAGILRQHNKATAQANGKQRKSPQAAGRQHARQRAQDADAELLANIRASKQGPLFAELFDVGDIRRYGGDDSAADLALINILAFWTGRDPKVMESLFSESSLGRREKWRERADYRERTIGKAIADCHEIYTACTANDRQAQVAQHNGPDVAAPPDEECGPRHEALPIILVTHEEHQVNDAAVEALAADHDLYQRNFRLVSVVRESQTKPGPRPEIRRPEGTPMIRPVQPARLREVLTRVAQWKTHKPKRNGKLVVVNAHPPAWSVAAILAREQWPNIRHLVGIVESPTLRDDGSVIEAAGYDPTTGLLYIPNGEFPKIPPKPTLELAEKAANVLFDLVRDFPFRQGHQAAWLAALLTPLARFLIDGPVPLLLFEANTSGAGKTKLCDLISIICTGREMTSTGYYHNRIEMDKQLVATGLAGDRVVLFDNIENGGRLGNSSLDRAVTARRYRGRVLGKSEMTPDLDLMCTFFATGNNLTLCGDIVRRVVPCRLESPMERPEERDDFAITKCTCGCHGDLLDYARRERGKLVAAAQTILGGVIMAGKPDQKLAAMDFTARSGLVRSAVHWATGLDPAIGRGDLGDSDPDRQHCAAFLAGWFEVQTDHKVPGMTSATMVKRLTDAREDDYLMLRNAVADLWPRTRPGELPSAGSIGMKIQAIRGKTFGGLMIDKIAEEKGAKVWSVSKLALP
jgi:hypothetical protein